jgi:hypothetical protein
VKFSIAKREGHVHAALHGRDTAEQMREFLLAVHAACREHRLPKILISVRQSRAVFRPEDYGLDGEMRGYANELVSAACQIALVGDTGEVNSANEYIEVVARQQGINVRAFRDERSALGWLTGKPRRAARRYRFRRIVIAGAPDDPGVYALWEGEELVYYGRADGKNEGGGATIRSRLLDLYYADPKRATHYSWEICKDPAAREAQLLLEHERAHGRPPRLNGKAA